MWMIKPVIKKRWYKFRNFGVQCRISCRVHLRHLTRTWHPAEPFKHHGWHWPSNPRVPLNLVLVWLILAGLVGTPLYIQAQQLARYQLTPAAEQLVGDTSRELTSKLSYDRQNGQFTFNYEQLTQSDQQDKKQSLKARVGGSGAEDQSTNLYSVELAQKLSGGMSVHDTNYDLSFDLVPQFNGDRGKRRGQHIVYPLEDGGQLVYTPRSNGFKEDIIHRSAPESGEISYAYRLNLPPTLEARKLDTGGIGIFSATPSLYGNISFGSDSDKTRVQEARVNADKNHLVFALPAPVVKATGNKQQATSNRQQAKSDTQHGNTTAPTTEVGSAEFQLEQLESSDTESSEPEQAATNTQTTTETTQDNRTTASNDNHNLPPQVAAARKATQKSQHYRLTLTATGLSGVTAPISIDPSVVVSSSSEFGDGNEEYGIDFGSGQVGREGLTGGELQSWSSTTSLNTDRDYHTSVLYNGYVYVIGGEDADGNTLASIEYASVNSDGTLGTWNTTSTMNTVRDRHSSVAYNGYVYVFGGRDGSGVELDSVEYAPINSDGTLGSWSTTSSLDASREAPSSVVYNGYVYVIGGHNGSISAASVIYAPVHADGTLGSWSTTSSMNNARWKQASVVYDGYIYTIGGQNDTLGAQSDVEYASINDDGALGTWQDTSSLGTARLLHTTVVYGGYIYTIGGMDGLSVLSSVEYAAITADGTLGAWSTTTSLDNTRSRHTSVARDGYIYTVSGNTSGASTVYNPIHGAGVTNSWQTTSSMSCAREDHSSAVYDGFIYAIAGNGCSSLNFSTLSSVEYAPINSDGTLGSWSDTSSLNNARSSHGSVAHDGYVYAIGGTDPPEYAPINSDGTLGSWSTTSSMNQTGRSAFGLAVYNGYIYASGGWDNGALTSVEYAPINSDGTLGSWSTTSSMVTDRSDHTSVTTNGYIYAIGGYNGNHLTSVEYAPINSDGTLGSWSTTSSMTTARMEHTSTVYTGHVYAIGARDSNDNALTSVEYAPINSDGTLGSWSTTSSMTTGRNIHASVTYHGYIYAIGGNGPLSSVEYAQIQNGGSGTVDSWSTTSSLGTARYAGGAVVHNDYVYSIGGHDGSSTLASVEYAPINSDGTLGSWSTTSSLNTARYTHGVAISDGYIYATGGYNGGVLSGVEYAPINSDGTLGSWSTTSSIARFAHDSIAYNGYVYVMGGSEGSGDMSDVSYASVNADGTLGSWQSTSGFSTARSYLASVTTDGYIYAVAGENSSTYISSVEYAPINSDGTLGTWQNTSQLNEPRRALTSVFLNGYLYAIGGEDNSGTELSTVEFASAGSGGGLGKWQQATDIGTARHSISSAVDHGHVYAIGGNTSSGNATTQVDHTALNSIPRSGRYSKMIDFGDEFDFSSISFNGDILGGNGVDVQYKTACSGGTFDATATTLHNVRSGATHTTGDTARYVLITFELDDQKAAMFPDDQSVLTDFTLNYSNLDTRASTDKRLRAGNFFESEEEQPYDTLAEDEVGETCS